MQGEANFFDEVVMSSTETPQTPQAAAPEAVSAPTTAPAATGEAATTAVMPTPPTLPEIPKPAPINEAAIAPTSVTGHASKAEAIEKQLAQFVAPYVPEALAANLTVNITLANSNAVTARSNDPKNLHDIAIEFKGDAFNTAESSKALTGHLLEAMRSHPAFKAIVFTVPNEPAQGSLRFAITALKEEQMQALLEAPARAVVVNATIVKDTAEVVASAAEPVSAPAAAAATEPSTSADKPAVAADAHVCGDNCAEHAAKPPADLPAAPVPLAVAPVESHGKVAANDQKVALRA
jgi:hypothetical protein